MHDKRGTNRPSITRSDATEEMHVSFFVLAIGQCVRFSGLGVALSSIATPPTFCAHKKDFIPNAKK